MKYNCNIYCHCEGKARGNLEKSNWITSLSLVMTNKKLRFVWGVHKILQNKKPRNKSHWAFYGADDRFQLEPSPNIYLEIIKELVPSSTVVFDIKTILQYSNTN